MYYVCYWCDMKFHRYINNKFADMFEIDNTV